MQGLSTYEVEQRIKDGLVNNTKQKYSRSVKTIILSNILTLFNLINVVLFILVLSTGSYKNGLFIFIIFINTLIAIYQEIKAKRIIDKLSITNQEKVKVLRDNKLIEIPVNEIVMDDILYLKSGDDVVVDSIIVKSDMCEVNQSVITGESDSIIKNDNDKLISGTIIVSGNCYVKVIGVGKDNYTNSLIKEASIIKQNNSYLMDSVNKILKIVTIAIVPTGILLFLTQFLGKSNYNDAILSTVAGIIGMIPEGLVLLTSVALTVGVIRMSKQKVIIQKLSGIEMLSCTDIICLDKTGTITDGSLEVIDVINIDKDNNNIISNIIPKECNNATDMALDKYFIKKDNLIIKKRIPFSTYRKFSAIVLDDVTYYLGAFEYITNKNISSYNKYLKQYIDDGYRILTLAKSNCEYIDKVDGNVEILSFIILKDNVRKNAKEVLEYFNKQKVDIKIISGDNPITVSNIMKSIKFDNYDKYIEASKLPHDFDRLKECVDNYSIYGRCNPQDKQLIIKALKEKSKVAMIGDGVNDILALKEADCAVALASGISAARSVSEVVLTTNDFNTLPSIVDEGRRVVNNIEKVSSLYLIKTTYSFILSILSIILVHEYPFYPIQLSLIGAICVGLPSFFLALAPNYNKVEFGFIKKVFRNALPSGLCVCLNILFLMIFTMIFNISFDKVRILVVCLTGLINLRLLYSVSRPFTLWKQMLFIGCSIVFFELLILQPTLFSVTRFNIITIAFIAIMFYLDLYIINILEMVYDKKIKNKRW